MKTLLLALGIIAAFGALFLIDRYNTGAPENEAEETDDTEHEGS